MNMRSVTLFVALLSACSGLEEGEPEELGSAQLGLDKQYDCEVDRDWELWYCGEDLKAAVADCGLELAGCLRGWAVNNPLYPYRLAWCLLSERRCEARAAPVYDACCDAAEVKYERCMAQSTTASSAD